MASDIRCDMLEQAAAQLATLTGKLEHLTGSDPAITRKRHDAGNALAAVRASVEAIADGVLEATPQRLANIQRSLETARDLLG